MEPTKAIRSLRALAQAVRAAYLTSPSASAEAVALDLEAQASQLERTVALAQAEERAWLQARAEERERYLFQAYEAQRALPCACKRGVARDNCPNCEGTGFAIDFAKIRAQALKSSKPESRS